VETITRAGPQHDDEGAHAYAERRLREIEEARKESDSLHRALHIEITEKIEVFARDCNTAEYTDTEEVWSIFYDIYELLGGDVKTLDHRAVLPDDNSPTVTPADTGGIKEYGSAQDPDNLYGANAAAVVPVWASRDLDRWTAHLMNSTPDSEDVKGQEEYYRLITARDGDGWCVWEGRNVPTIVMIRRVEGLTIVRQFGDGDVHNYVGRMASWGDAYIEG